MPSTVFKRGDRWAARVTIAGEQTWLGTHATREDAEDAVRRAKRQGSCRVTVGEWADMWQAMLPGTRTLETERHNAQMVAPFVRRFGARRLESLTELEVALECRKRPASARYVRSMLGAAVRCGIPAPAGGVVAQRKRPKPTPTPDVVVALEGAARARGWGNFADCIVFTAHSGLRLSEVARVQASDVLMDGRRVVAFGKRSQGERDLRRRVVPVLPPGRAALARQLPDVGLVWRSPQGRPLTRESVSRMFRACAADVGFGGTFHSLRRFYATALRDAGADRADIALAMGHVDGAGRPYPELVDRVYAAPSAEAAIARIEAVAV